jgi:hypothetical protein
MSIFLPGNAKLDRIAYRWPVFDTADVAAGIEAIVFKQFLSVDRGQLLAP